jgi:glyoxylase I family protein
VGKDEKMSIGIHHLALRTADPDALERFYGGVVGLGVRRRDATRGSVWLDAGATVVMIETVAPGEPRAPAGAMDLVAFAIDDKDAWRRRLVGAGVAIEDETPYTLYVRDPDGRRVGFSTFVFGG